LWAAWHLPYFVVPTLSSSRVSFAFYVLEVMALSVVFAWLYLRTKGSLLLVTLFHSAINATLLTLPAPKLLSSTLPLPADFAPWLSLGLLWMTAVYCARQMPGGESVDPHHPF
jgi:membrane protease YdiL (CAAX protease family)